MKSYNQTYSMTKNPFQKVVLLSLLLFVVLFSSCEQGDQDIDTDNTEKPIPIDSIYLTCKLDNKVIVFQSPTAKCLIYGKGSTRLYKVKNSPQDSVLIEYTQELQDDNYNVKVSMCDVFLVDTMSIPWMLPNVKKELFLTGTYPLQFMALLDNENMPVSKMRGFHISIYDLKSGKDYNSNFSSFYKNDTIAYNDFKKDSEFKLTSAFEIKTELSSENSLLDILNPWFIKARFHCKMYNIRRDGTYDKYELTDGVLNMVF